MYALSEEPDARAMLVAEVRRFARTHLDAAASERAGRIPREVLSGLAELGLFGLALPIEFGGAGLSLTDACAVIEELARWDRSVATCVGLHTGLGTRALVTSARPDVAREWLPRLATGEILGAFAATEACAGSDLMAMRTTARFEGDAIVLDGEKSYVTNGGLAGCYTVLARTGARGHALVLVPRGTPGVEIGAEENKLGIRASSTVTVSFSGARVPVSHLLGAPDRGLEGAYGVLAWGRTLMSAGCLGTMRAALDASLAHVTTRVQFRRPLADFGAVKARVAEMAASLFAARALVGRAALAAARDEAAETTTMAAKVFASERTFEACDSAIQLHGALGVLEDVGVARLLRDCRVTRIFEGANDVLLLRIAAARLTRRAPSERLDPAALFHSDLAAPCNALADELDAVSEALREVHGAAVIGKQTLLVHLARALVGHLAATATALAAGPADGDLAHAAVRRLVDGAGAELDRFADVDEETVCSRIAEQLYEEVT